MIPSEQQPELPWQPSVTEPKPSQLELSQLSVPEPEPPPFNIRDVGKATQCGPSNTAALKHGAFSSQVRQALLPEQQEVLRVLSDVECAIETDLGGRENISTIARDLISRYMEVSIIANHLGHLLTTEGPLTPKGAQRAALTAYLGVVGTQFKIAMALGLELKQRPVNDPRNTTVTRIEHKVIDMAGNEEVIVSERPTEQLSRAESLVTATAQPMPAVEEHLAVVKEITAPKPAGPDTELLHALEQLGKQAQVEWSNGSLTRGEILQWAATVAPTTGDKR